MATKTLRVTLADILGVGGPSGRVTGEVWARFVDGNGAPREVRYTDGTLVVITAPRVALNASGYADFVVVPNDDATVHVDDQGFGIQVGWDLTARGTHGRKVDITGPGRTVVVTSSSPAIAQFGLLATAIPVIVGTSYITQGNGDSRYVAKGAAPTGVLQGLTHQATEYAGSDSTVGGFVDIYSQIGTKTSGHDLSLVVGGTADIGFRHLPGGTGNMMLEINAMVPSVMSSGWAIKQSDNSTSITFPSSGGKILFKAKAVGDNGANGDLYLQAGGSSGNVYIANSSGTVKFSVAETTGVVYYSTATTSVAGSFYVTGEANPRISIRADGLFRWGAGGASAVDTQLSRTAAGVLAVGAAQCLKTGLNATASRPSASSMTEGAQFYDQTLHKPIWSDGTNWRDGAGTVV